MMHEVGIIGASGYTGGELLRLLCRHPSLRVDWATSRQHAGLPAGEVFSSLRDFTDVVFCAPDLARLPTGLEAVFVALPHVEATPTAKDALRRGGYLTRDSRKKERKKYGLKGARARFQFSKR